METKYTVFLLVLMVVGFIAADQFFGRDKGKVKLLKYDYEI